MHVLQQIPLYPPFPKGDSLLMQIVLRRCPLFIKGGWGDFSKTVYFGAFHIRFRLFCLRCGRIARLFLLEGIINKEKTQ
jgi:hypothetical protein